MKIAQVVCVYPPYKGGMGNSAYEISRRLVGCGHEVDVHTISRGEDAGVSIEDGVRVIRRKPFLGLGNAAALPFNISTLDKYDIIHLHYPFFGTAEIIWALKKVKPELKLVLHFHMEAKFDNPLLKVAALPDLMIRKSLFKMADGIICSSIDYISSSFLKNDVIDLEKSGRLTELPFGVDIERFYPDNKVKDDRHVKILFVGGLDKAHYFKGIDVLIRALATLTDLPWSLRIIGNGELQEEYQKLTREFGIADRVAFLNNVSYHEIPALYRQSDLFVLPSINRGEAFGLVLLEAMASGLAVIASRLPGVRTVFNEGIEGAMAQPGSADDLAEKIKEMMADSRNIKMMGERGRRLAIDKYDWSVVIGRLENIYKKILRK